MEPRYKLVFTGKLQGSCSAEQAIAGVTAVFNLPVDAVSNLIYGGKARVVRRDVDRPTAERLAAVLGDAGLEMRILSMESRTSAASSEPLSEPVSEPASEPLFAPTSEPTSERTGTPAGPRCPRCGSSRVEGDTCLVCGLSLDQFRIQQAVRSNLGGVVAAESEARLSIAAARHGSKLASPSFKRRDQALNRTIAHPGRRGSRVPVYALGAGVGAVALVALMIMLQPESDPPPIETADGVAVSGKAASEPTPAPVAAGFEAPPATRIGSIDPATVDVGAAAPGADRVGSAPPATAATAEQMANLLATVRATQADMASRPAASQDGLNDLASDDLPPEIRALYEAQQKRQALSKTLQAIGAGAPD